MMRVLYTLLVLLCGLGEALAQGTPQGLNALGAAGALSTTDTLPVCQVPGGCGTSNPLKSATGTQVSSFIASQGVTPVAGACVHTGGWNVCAPTGLTTSDADTAMLVAAAAASPTTPVLLSPGVYYTCGTTLIDTPRYGHIAGSGISSWFGPAVAPPTVPYPMGARLYCNDGTKTGPIIKAHNNVVLEGFSMMGTNNGSNYNTTMVSGVNSIGTHFSSLQFFYAGRSLDMSSSSVSGDQGVFTGGNIIDDISCYISSECIYADEVNGGNGFTDFKIRHIECEQDAPPDNYCINLTGTSSGQIDDLRMEDGGNGLYLANGQHLHVDNILCHMPGGSSPNICVQIVEATGNSGPIFLSHIVEVPESSPGTYTGDVFITCPVATCNQYVWLTQSDLNMGGLQITNPANGAFAIIDGTIPLFNASTQALEITYALEGPQAYWFASGNLAPNFTRVGFTLAAGTLQLPSCTSGRAGYALMITDYNTTYPAVDTTLTPGTNGGGTTAVPVTCNGSIPAWKSR